MLDLNIYPIDMPEIKFKNDLDFLLMELPPRYMPMMPNGLGHVSNILKGIDINYQVFDANIILYHQYHSNRVLNNLTTIITSTGFEFPEDPWHVTFVDDWDVKDEVQDYFSSFIDKIILEILKSKPKILGFSINGNNIKFTEKLAKTIKELLPETIILVGGYTCVFYEVGPKVFNDYDYMVIGESELSLASLTKRLLSGERPKDLAGILSKYDSDDRKFISAPLLHDLDSIDFPKYEWIDYGLYKTYLGTNLVPIAGSRGCVWSRCAFCSEKFMWRRRSPLKIADEFEWHRDKGGYSFHFNESDLNGDPESLVELCKEIIKRKLVIKFVGQLRIHKKSTREFFDILKSAGFDKLRFGVDGWSKNTNKIQKKGYPVSLIDENLKACHKSGIEVGVNIVMGVPGETEDDIDEIIEKVRKNKKYIFKVENLNVLILGYGNNYYEDPEKYNIKFYGDKDEIYSNNPTHIPSELWYWEKDGVIVDHNTRLNRLKKISTALEEMGLFLTPYTNKKVNEKLNLQNKENKVQKIEDSSNKVNFNDIIQDGFVIYGTGELGRRVSQNISDKPNIYFTDSNSKFWNTTMHGLDVIPNNMLLEYTSTVLIASVAYEKEIRDFLVQTYGDALTIVSLDNLK
ncbi:MAG: B12-binding domain-containing radical SAM protein [Sulfurovum sp.]|nr:B12-binding domain-containing radical SAM protein [Sulfurovaceae bacterium]